MFSILLFFCMLLSLFFLSRKLTRNLSYLLYRITGSEKITIYSMAFLFFPGTLIHELSHYLAALLLFVRVGRMEFFPKIMEAGVKLGSVQIGSTDPIRRALIGMAPFFLGTALILLVLSLFHQYGGIEKLWITILTGYIVFEISNTMFSSRKDMEGTLELFLALLVVGIIFYLLGLRLPEVHPETMLHPDVVHLFTLGSVFLAIPLVLDLMLLLLLRLLRVVHH